MPPTCALRPMIPSNVCTLRITAAAGTKFAGAYSPGTVIIVPGKRALQPEGLLHSRGMAGSGLRPLSKIPHCCPPWESGPCLSPSVADHPLRPATDRRLGRPLPHQLANPTRADPKAINLSPCGHIRYCSQFPGNIPNLRARSHVLLTRLPLLYCYNRSTCMC